MHSRPLPLIEFAAGLPQDAQRAIAELNNTELMGRTIFVREDREPQGGACGLPVSRATRVACAHPWCGVRMPKHWEHATLCAAIPSA